MSISASNNSSHIGSGKLRLPAIKKFLIVSVCIGAGPLSPKPIGIPAVLGAIGQGPPQGEPVA